jgi:CRP-like cAMP-binding protein
METEILNYLSKYLHIPEELKEVISQSTIVRHFPKGSVLLREGDRSNTSYFVLKGCVRSYALQNGEEKTLEFYTEEDPILPVNYGTSVLSEHFIECVEDCTLTVSTPEHEKRMFEEHPQFESVCRIMSEVMLARSQESFVNYRLAGPADRYRFLLKYRPSLIQRVPQYQLASYLGIQPESLSRLKKKLLKKDSQGLIS